MKTSHRIAAIAFREARRFAAIAAERAGRKPENSRKQRPTFRPLTDSEAEALLSDELLAALSDAHRRAIPRTAGKVRH